MDSFLAANASGPTGSVIGVDMTKAQLNKATRLADEAGFAKVEFCEGYIEDIAVDDGTVDCGISNGVISLSPDKPSVFRAAAARETATANCSAPTDSSQPPSGPSSQCSWFRGNKLILEYFETAT